MRVLLAVLCGILLGIIGSRILLVGSAFSLIPWGIMGILVGLYAHSKKEAALNGAIYGFVLSFIFMISGYTGSKPIIAVIPFFALLGLFGAFCGTVLALVGALLKKKVKK